MPAATPEALSRKRKRRPLIGVMLTVYFCNGCATSEDERGASYVDDLRVGDDAGKPIACARCGRHLEANNG